MVGISSLILVLVISHLANFNQIIDDFTCYMKDGKVYFCQGGKRMRNSIELDGISMYKTDFANNVHTFEKF